MRIPHSKITIAVALSLAGWALLFARQFVPFEAAARLSPWIPLGVSIAALVTLYLAGLGDRARRALAIASGLVVVGSVALITAGKDTEALADQWRKHESRRIVSILFAVGERVGDLQELSTGIGEKTSAFLFGEGRTAGEDTLGIRLEAFGLLGEEAERIRKSDRLPPGTAIGIQLFDEGGARLAWAGWPQLLGDLDREFVAGDEALFYTRQASLYRILTHIIPLRDSGGRKRATVVVDMPLEVNYKVNNKFLKSASLVDNVEDAGAASVRFDYYPTARNLPLAINDYELHMRARQRAIDARPDAAGAADDSLLTYFPFPATVEPMGDIRGDDVTGLSGRVLIRSVLGNPLLNVSVIGRPFRFFSGQYSERYRIAGAALILAALFIFFILSMLRFPARLAGPLGSVKALYFAGFVVFVRYCLLTLQPVFGGVQPKLFDPAIFATPILGGLMRSAGDLLVTSAFFVVALYGVLKITRDTSGPRPAAVTTPGSIPVVVFKAIVTAAAVLASFELARRFVRSVVLNANPRLVGETMNVFESQTLVLHLSTFLMVAGIFMSGMILAWGVHRLGNRAGATRSTVAAAALIVVAALFLWRWEIAFIGLLLILFIAFAPRIVQREDLVSIVIVAFCFVIVISNAGYVFLNEEYQGLRRTFIQEKVAELTHPVDNWKVFILEDVLESFSQDDNIRETLKTGGAEDVQRLAFDLWAGSPLSLLGYSSAIHVFDESDSLVSRFTVEMPFRVRQSETGEPMETAGAQEWVVLDLTTNTPQGLVRYYRGIVNIGGYLAAQGNLLQRRAIGKVVVDIPFFFESLAWSARTGPQTPEVLRNVQEGGIEPRLEEPEALLLARLNGTRVVESSSDVLPAGFTINDQTLDAALGLEWPLLSTAGPTYRTLARETDEPGSYLLAAFPVPRPLQHVLRWSTILSLYFFFAVGTIVLIILLKSMPFLRRLLPTLTPGRQLGFQQKLLGSFLVVALLPAIMLGVFSVGIIRERFEQENRKEALQKSYAAYKTLSRQVVDEMNYLFEHSDLRDLIAGDIPRYFARDRTRLVRIMNEDGSLVSESSAAVSSALPETTGAAFNGADILATFPPEEVFVQWVNGRPYLAVLSHPISVVLDRDKRTFFLYYARLLSGDLLGDIADKVGGDVNVFDDGELIATSREGLLSGGFLSSMMNSSAFVKVSLMDVDHSLVTETAGRYRYEVAYVPILSARRYGNAALGLPLLFRPESFHAEVQKTTSVVFSIFALLSAATIGLGLLLARGIFEPLKGLLEGTRRISRGDLAFKLPEKRHDEIGTVVHAFNEMTGQLSRSQAALEERRRYLEVILVNIGTGVISTDADDRIRAVNSAAERILNIKSDDVLGKSGDELIRENVVPQFFSLLAREKSVDSPFVSSEVDLVMKGNKHTIKYMQTRLSTDGRYLGTVYVFEDLTELINSKKLSAWVEMARQIAHEIKNPLTPIKLSTQFMVRAHEEKAGNFDDIFRESSETIIQQVEVLRRIASEFSSFGRMQQLKLRPLRVVEHLEKIVVPYRKNTAGVDISISSHDGELTAVADTEAIRKICTNLIENAMEAMPGGGKLEIVCDAVDLDGRPSVRIRFRDTGPGLSDEARDKLFEPYFSTKTTGTGLGLAICRRLSHEMGGDVVVENLDGGRGVEATLYLRRS